VKNSPLRDVKEVRIRIELNRGRVGMPLGKLADVMKDTVRFLESLSDDLQIADADGRWLAEKFENNSVDFDLRLHRHLTPLQHSQLRSGLRSCFSPQHRDPMVGLLISEKTRHRFADLAKEASPGDPYFFGLYQQDSEEILEELFPIDSATVSELAAAAYGYSTAYGEVQGIVYSFVKEAKQPHLTLRELSTQHLVKCYFTPEQYAAAVELLTEREAVVFVEGETTQDTAKNQVTSIQVASFRLAPEFSLDALRAWAGSFPDFTGSLSTEAHLDLIRHG
jgi:hypothetical protein